MSVVKFLTLSFEQNEELSEEKQDLSLQRIYKLTKDLKNEVNTFNVLF